MIKFRIVSARVFAVGSRSKSYVLLEQQQQATANCGVKLGDALCCLCSFLVFDRELVFNKFDIDVKQYCIASILREDTYRVSQKKVGSQKVCILL